MAALLRRRTACLAVAATLLAALVGMALWAPPPAIAAGPSLAAVVSALEKSPVYIDPAAGEPRVDAARLLAVIPKATYFAALPSADIAATIDPADGVPAPGDPAALPPLLSSKVGRGGTFVVLIGGKLYGASTTVPGSLQDTLGSAQSTLPASGDGTGALVAMLRSLGGSGDLTDTASPSHAGGPVGPEVLVGLAILLAVGAFALWWWIRRPPRRRKPRPARPLGDLVEIDSQGNIIKRTPARDRQR